MAWVRMPQVISVFQLYKILWDPLMETMKCKFIRVRESAGINRLETENERVLQRKLSQSLWPRTLRCHSGQVPHFNICLVQSANLVIRRACPARFGINILGRSIT